MGTEAPAGWYDDGTGKQRWWDGTRWSEEFIDLREPTVELRADGGPAATGPARAGWYDDQRGRRRWWDGRQWTRAVAYSGEERSYAGVVIDGRWIHFGDLSQPVAGVQASIEPGATLLRTPAFTRAAVERRLWSASGQVTPRQLDRVISRSRSYLVITGPDQVWACETAPGSDAEGRDFVTWVRSLSDHYRYR